MSREKDLIQKYLSGENDPAIMFDGELLTVNTENMRMLIDVITDLRGQLYQTSPVTANNPATTGVVEIFTDGACSGNPGPGGWGVVLRYKTVEKELSGFEANTTNNRMELTAVVKALSALKYPCHVILTTDSKYVCDSISKGWAKSWQKKRLDEIR